MNTKHLLTAMAFVAIPVAAQETYQDAKLAEKDLNGTARYVGMGGAMEALGADISTISTNPAGLGLFRSSQLSASGGLVSQPNAKTTLSYEGIDANFNGNKTNMSFDQIGFVWVNRSHGKNFINLGFNYHKSRNFDQILSAVGPLTNASQNKLTAIKFPFATETSWNGVDANYETLMSKSMDGQQMDYYNGHAFAFGQYQKGYIGEYDVNVSGNIKDRVYLGLTLGLHDVNYRSSSYYTENLEQNTMAESWESLQIDGSGFDIKAGVIFRPIAASPFRIGVYVNSPVFYDLRLRGANDVTLTNSANAKGDSGQEASYDFRLNTPWKFGISLGHTVSNYLALGATYEFADYGSTDNRIINGGYYDPWSGGYYDTSSSDEAMNAHTKATLKGVHTLKLGAEYKPTSAWAIRLGYNFVSPMFREQGFRDGSIDSPGNAYATSTDYTNWKSTNRITAGLGYATGKFNIDLAYQYSQTNGEFFPFMNFSGGADHALDNVVSQTNVSDNRHQVLLTVGYRF